MTTLRVPAAQRRALRTLATGNTVSACVARRAKAILSLAAGHSVRATALRVRLAPRVIQHWKRVYMAQGASGLHGARQRRSVPQQTRPEREIAGVFAFVHYPEAVCHRHGVDFSRAFVKRIGRRNFTIRPLGDLHLRVEDALYVRSTGNTLEIPIRRGQIEGLSPANKGRAFKIIRDWLRDVGGVLIDEKSGQMLTKVTADRDRGRMRLAWIGPEETNDLQAALLKDYRVARYTPDDGRDRIIGVRVTLLPPMFLAARLRTEPQTWLSFLSNLLPGEQKMMRPLLEALDRSRGWRFALCRSCHRRGNLGLIVKEGKGNVKDCYQCRLHISSTQRWRQSQEKRPTSPRPRRVRSDLTGLLAAYGIPLKALS